MFLAIVFVIAALSFAVSASRGYGGAANADQFFHVAGERRNVVSLAIADITLGTGLVYLLTAASLNGLSMLLVTIATGIGYFLFAHFMMAMHEGGVLKDGNLLLGIRAELSGSSQRSRWLFDAAVTIPLVAIFLFLFAFELFASSAIIAAFAFPSFASGQIIVAGILFIVSYVNCMAGGMQASHRNDALLAVGILSLIVIVVVASIVGKTPTAGTSSTSTLLWGSSGFSVAALTVAVAVINALATQFYSLLNAYTASNFQSPAALSKSMVRVGVVVAILLSILVGVGAVFPMSDVGQAFPTALVSRLQVLWGDGWIGNAVQALIVFGMSAVVFSTIDTLMVALSYFVHRNLLSAQEINEAQSNVSGPRKTLTVLFALGFFPIAFLFLAQPNLFFLLLSIAAGAAIFAPFLVSQGLIIARGYRVEGPTILLAGTFLLFVVTATTSIILTALKSPASAMLSLTAILISVVMSIAAYVVSVNRN